MRLTAVQIAMIRESVAQLVGNSAHIWLFGSRMRDNARDGDVDLLLELVEPAQLPARVVTRVSRATHGRKVDVLIKAPNLKVLPIRAAAQTEGIRL